MRHLIPALIFLLLPLGSPLTLAGEPRPHPELQRLGANQALDLGRYQCPNDQERDASNCATITDYSGMVYDGARHQLLLFGGGHAATYRDDVEVFDLNNLEWRSAYAPTPCAERRLDNVDAEKGRWISSNHPIARHTYDLLAMAGEPAELFLFAKVQGRGRGCHRLPEGDPYVIAKGRVAAFDPDSNQWRYTETATLGYPFTVETDPVSGRILVIDRRSLRTFNPKSGKMMKHKDFMHEDMHWARNLIYYPPLDRFYYMVQGGQRKGEVLEGVYEIVPDRDNWSDSRIRRLEVDSPGETANVWAYDSANELIGGGPFKGRFHAFDPRTGEWHIQEIETESPHDVGTVSHYVLAFDPINEVYLFRTDRDSGRRTWAYRWK